MSLTTKARIPRIDFSLDLAVRIEGIKLPFRLRCSTANHSELMSRLDDFWKMIKSRLNEITEEN